MANVINRALSALNPWYNWGVVTVERLDAVNEDHGNEGDVRFFDLQWFGLHLSFQIGRQPPKATPEQVASRVRYRLEYAERRDQRRQQREAWNTAHQAYLTARAYFDALPIGTPGEDAQLDVWVDAMCRMIENVAAPDGEALAIKIELASTSDIDMRPEWYAAFAADARRLHAEGY